MASRSSSGKKNDTSIRIKISTKKDKKKENVIESCESGDEDEDEEILPSKPRKGNCSFNRSAFSMPDDISKLMNRVLCCSCGKQINPMNPGAVRRHPWLKVVTCKKCYKFLKSGPFTRDQEGTDEQCRWCGDGGRLYGCDYCSHCFCRSCIKRNLGRTEAAHMENEDNSKWKCYLCKPKKISQLVGDCNKILNYIEKEEKKEREREERAKQREKDKLQKIKEEKALKQLETSKEKESTPQKSTKGSLPAPKSKDEVKSRESTPQLDKGKRDSPVIIDDESPIKPIKPRIGTYTNPTPGQGVQGVKKLDNGTFAVTVGPRPIRPVIAYAATSVPLIPRQSTPLINPLKIQSNPITSSVIRDALIGNQARVPQVTVDKKTGKALPNDLKAAYDTIYPHNVDSTTEKMATVAQSLTLYLNSVKTDLAIAKLSHTNPFQARNIACNSLKKGLDIFFNGLQEILNVQFLASSPSIDLFGSKAETSTPKANKNVKKENLDVSTIPICLDDSDVGEQKESTTQKEDIKGKQGKSESNDDSCMIVSDTEDKSQVVMEVDDEDGNTIKVQKVNESADETKSSGSDEAKSKKEKSVEKETKENNVKTAKKNKGASKANDTDSKGKKDNEEDETVAGDKTNDSENTAAELELLKEMADELNEMNEKSSPEKAEKSSKDSTDGEKDSKGKVANKSGKKAGQKETDSDLSTKSDSKDTSKSGNNDDIEDDQTQNSSRSLRKTRSKVIEPDDGTSGSDEKAKPGSKLKGKNEDTEKLRKNDKASNGLNVEAEDEKDKKKKQGNTSKAGKDLKSGSDDESAETETKKKQGKNSKAGKNPDKITDKVDDKNEIEKSKDKKNTSKVSKNNSDKEEGSLDPENLEPKEQVDEKVLSELSNDSDSDDSDSDEDEPKKRKRSARKGKASENKKSEKSSKKTSRKSDGQDAESSSKAEKKKSTKTTKKKSSEEEGDPGSDSSNYDPDLEKEIKSLAKDTKMRPRRSCVKETDEKASTKDSKSKDDKASAKSDKKGQSRKGKKDSVDDISNDDEDQQESEEEEEKPKKKGKHSSRSQGSSPESDLEEEEEKPKKGRAGRSRKTAESSQESDIDTGDNKKGKKGKKAASSKGKKNILEDISSDEDQPDDDEPDDEDDDDTDVSSSSFKNISGKRKSLIEDSEDNSDDFLEEEGSCDTSDPEVSFPKLGSPKKGKGKEKPAKKGKKGAKLEIEELSEDSDFVTSKTKKKKKIRDKLLDAKVSDSDTDVGKKGKGKGKGTKKRKRKTETEEEEEEEDGDESGGKKKKGKGKRRKRIKKVSSSDDEKEPGADDELGDEEDDDEEEDGHGGFLKRKKIRKVQTNKKLKDATKAARKAEEERRKRIAERQKEYNTYVEVEGGESEEELPEGTERHKEEDTNTSAIAKILGSPKKIPITTKCVLELDKDKKPLIEVDKILIRKLKPHQVEAVRFMYNCCIESLERMHKGQESGCILAHCMGLGKTLSVISFVHTMLRNVKLTKMTKCLVVCPLNTVLNWVNEFEIWLADVDYEIEVFEMSRVKANFERAQMLKEWHESRAGVMILGYDMYRNLVQGSHCKNKKQKKTFYETLADPGPDIVVCDEGHILKNDQTSLSKSMSKIKAKKRIVLTGTPLQNNLGEYHCMVNFVKPSLVGTRKEFANRFVNPITNGQCSDSTPADVKLMKRRAHILHELLAGCVQRKDYSALTKFLPPKMEYVVSVRLAKTQMSLYEKYLELSTQGGLGEGIGKGARLFKDYQALMRIWTHPWVLKLDEIRQENKRMYDDSEDSFIDDESDGEDSFIDNSTSSSDSDESDHKRKKKKKGGSGSSSSDDEKKNGDANENEVVKKWTSRRRGNEEGAGSSWMEDMGYAPEGPKEVSSEWWAEYVKEEDEFKLEQSGKLMLLFQILKMCEDIGDKVLVFSQSLLSLDIIEDFLQKIDEANNPATEEKKEGEEEKKEGEDGKKEGEDGKKEDKDGKKEDKDEKKEDKEKKAEVNGDVNGSGDKAEEPKEDPLAQYGKSWVKGADYFRMDGSTNSQNRKASQDRFNDPENYRARLFLISTKAGSLGINLVAANRVIIFDASWNPSHDIQSIFRVYRFGQVKPVYVYRFLAQGTMEEKIYERQVTKQSLSQRVVDEHQIDRHFTASDLQELYRFSPDRLDDPDRKERPLPMLPKDHMLAELMSSQKEWIVTFHEHDSLLENKIEQELSEEEKKAAWEDYEEEKKGRPMMMMYQNQGMYNQQGGMPSMHPGAQPNIDPQVVMQIVQDLKARYPNLPPEIFQQRVQAVLRQVLTTQVMQQTELQRRMLNQQKANELHRLNQIKQQIQQQQAMVNNQQQVLGMSGFSNMSQFGMSGASGISGLPGSAPRTALAQQLLGMNQQMKNLQSKMSGSQAGQDKRS